MALHAEDRHPGRISLPWGVWRGHSYNYHPMRALHAKNIWALHAPGTIKYTSDWWHAHAGGFWCCFWRECLTSCVGTVPPAWAFWVSSVGIFWCKLSMDKKYPPFYQIRNISAPSSDKTSPPLHQIRNTPQNQKKYPPLHQIRNVRPCTR